MQEPKMQDIRRLIAIQLSYCIAQFFNLIKGEAPYLSHIPLFHLLIPSEIGDFDSALLIFDFFLMDTLLLEARIEGLYQFIRYAQTHFISKLSAFIYFYSSLKLMNMHPTRILSKLLFRETKLLIQFLQFSRYEIMVRLFYFILIFAIYSTMNLQLFLMFSFWN